MFRYKLNKVKTNDNYKSIQGITLNCNDWFLSRIKLNQLNSYIDNQIVIEEELDNSGHVLTTSYIQEKPKIRVVKKVEKEKKEFFKTPEFGEIKEEEKPAIVVKKEEVIKKEPEKEIKDEEISVRTVKMMDQAIDNLKEEKKEVKRAYNKKIKKNPLDNYFLTV